MAPLSTVVQIFALPDSPPPLHAPDGFFSVPLALAGYAVAALVVGLAVYRVNRELNERMVPMMGVMAAFIFAAQMLNFPVIGGTSGHLVGGALAAIILGPWAAVLVMTSVVGLQALLFQDGGLLALGLNIVNIAVLSCVTGYAVYWVGRRFGDSFAVMAVAGVRGSVDIRGGRRRRRRPAARGVGHDRALRRARRNGRGPRADRRRRGPDYGRRPVVYSHGAKGPAPSSGPKPPR